MKGENKGRKAEYSKVAVCNHSDEWKEKIKKAAGWPWRFLQKFI
jgi:hypothetical protein